MWIIDLLNIFLERAKYLQQNLSNCRGQFCNNGANLKGKQVGGQSGIFKSKSSVCTLRLPLTEFGCYWRCQAVHQIFEFSCYSHAIFSSFTKRWSIWRQICNCLFDLKQTSVRKVVSTEEFSTEKKDRTTATESRSLVTQIASGSIILLVTIWYEILFEINEANKTIQSSVI